MYTWKIYVRINGRTQWAYCDANTILDAKDQFIAKYGADCVIGHPIKA